MEERETGWWGRAKNGYQRFNDATESWYRRWALPILATLCVLVTLASLPSGVASLRNEGEPGVFTAVTEDCTGRAVSLCLWQGTFTSDDGTVTSDDATYDGPGVREVGDRTSALAVEKHPDEVYAPGDPPILWLTPFGILSLAYLVWWSRRRWRSRDATPIGPVGS